MVEIYIEKTLCYYLVNVYDIILSLREVYTFSVNVLLIYS